jgi:hypothetical protein
MVMLKIIFIKFGWESLDIGVIYMIVFLSVLFIFIGKVFLTIRNRINK